MANKKLDAAIRDVMNGPPNSDILAMTMEFAIKAAEDWDTAKQIGGDVDSLELSADGKMRWIHVKKECDAPIQ